MRFASSRSSCSSLSCCRLDGNDFRRLAIEALFSWMTRDVSRRAIRHGNGEFGEGRSGSDCSRESYAFVTRRICANLCAGSVPWPEISNPCLEARNYITISNYSFDQTKGRDLPFEGYLPAA